jgi:hypothetical protein
MVFRDMVDYTDFVMTIKMQNQLRKVQAGLLRHLQTAQHVTPDLCVINR